MCESGKSCQEPPNLLFLPLLGTDPQPMTIGPQRSSRSPVSTPKNYLKYYVGSRVHDRIDKVTPKNHEKTTTTITGETQYAAWFATTNLAAYLNFVRPCRSMSFLSSTQFRAALFQILKTLHVKNVSKIVEKNWTFTAHWGKMFPVLGDWRHIFQWKRAAFLVQLFRKLLHQLSEKQMLNSRYQMPQRMDQHRKILVPNAAQISEFFMQIIRVWSQETSILQTCHLPNTWLGADHGPPAPLCRRQSVTVLQQNVEIWCANYWPKP